jgi:hypothetical protein
VEREVASTVLYHKERLAGALAGAVVRAGWGAPGEASTRLARALGFPPAEADPGGGLAGAPGGRAAVAGALAGLAPA